MSNSSSHRWKQSFFAEFGAENLPVQAGFTLIEMMLASTLGLSIMFGCMQIYLAVEKTFKVQQAITQIQENSRFAVHFLSERIRMAGYANCAIPPSFVDADLAIKGYQNTLPNFLRGKVLQDTDSIVIGLCELNSGVTKFDQFAFFIGATSRKNKLGKTIYALYETTMAGSKRELVSGVSDMRINYGVATADGKEVSQYLPADSIGDWKKIKAVEIALLFDSEFPVLPKAESYLFTDASFPPDRFLHREWNIYIALREF